MKVYITRNALVEGIRVIDASPSTISDGGFETNISFCRKNECHLTIEEAIKRAEEMRDRKIASLEKQIKKLQEMKFVVMA